jgi:hypothetical protein
MDARPSPDTHFEFSKTNFGTFFSYSHLDVRWEEKWRGREKRRN